jgi:hypothetical protein
VSVRCRSHTAAGAGLLATGGRHIAIGRLPYAAAAAATAGTVGAACRDKRAADARSERAAGGSPTAAADLI